MGYIKRIIPIILALGLWGTGPDKHVVEEFAGDAQIAGNLRQMGYVALALDSRYEKVHDVLTAKGFYVLIASVWTTCLGGLLWLAPPCSSWVWMSRSSTGRHLHVLGDRAYANVRAQNALVARITYAVVLCIKRGVHWIIEQPSSSVMWDHPRLQAVLGKYKNMTYTATVELGTYNLEARKELRLVGTSPHLRALDGTKMTAEQRMYMNMDEDRKRTAKHWKTADGRPMSRATEDLKPTQSYPLGFGAANAVAFYDEGICDPTQPMQPGLRISSDDDESAGIEDLTASDDDEYLKDLLNGIDMWEGASEGEFAVPLLV